MFESFIITLREGIEASLVIGILVVAIRALNRKDLEKPVWIGMGLAVVSSIFMAFVLMQFIEGYEEAYEGFLYLIAAFFVITMMVWMHRKSNSLKEDLEKQVKKVAGHQEDSLWREKLTLGLFTFLMVFREGAETVAFLGAVTLKDTETILSFFGGAAGLLVAVVFCVLFIRGTVVIDLKRFFFVTEWILGILVAQLLINGYHELAEAGFLPATQTTMATIGPLVKNNTLFLIAILALPLFIWISSPIRTGEVSDEALSDAERRLEKARKYRYRAYRYGAVSSLLFLLLLMGFVYAQEIIPKKTPVPKILKISGDHVVIPREDLEDGKLHHYAQLVEGKLVRLLAMKTSSGKYRTTLDACEICGPLGYFQEGPALVCINCSAEINPNSLGLTGGCNPIPLSGKVKGSEIQIPHSILQKEAYRFEESSSREVECPVCEMKFRINRAMGLTNYQDRIYYFCPMKGCQEQFLKNPGKFVK